MHTHLHSKGHARVQSHSSSRGFLYGVIVIKDSSPHLEGGLGGASEWVSSCDSVNVKSQLLARSHSCWWPGPGWCSQPQQRPCWQKQQQEAGRWVAAAPAGQIHLLYIRYICYITRIGHIYIHLMSSLHYLLLEWCIIFKKNTFQNMWMFCW